jgi:hypothetical protein
VCGEYSFEYDVYTKAELLKIPDNFITSTVLSEAYPKSILRECSNWVKETRGIKIKIGNIASGEKDVDNKELRQKLHEKINTIA